MRRLLWCVLVFIMFLIPLQVHAAVYNGSWQDKDGFVASYPILDMEDNRVEEKINGAILNIVQNYADRVKKGYWEKASMTFYTKYEAHDIVNYMFYVNYTDDDGEDHLKGFTVTYDKHTGDKIPVSRYLRITLTQLQNALNNSKAYAVDGLDNGVNLKRKIPYVSDNYFIVTDGSIGLLYQPGELMGIKDGAVKIVIAPETVLKTYELNK